MASLPVQDDVDPEMARLVADPAFNIFYNAPALVLICATLPDPMVRHDCTLAAGTLMLAAHGRGLGSCWIGFCEPWLTRSATRQELALADYEIPVAPIILGHPRACPVQPPRRRPAISWLGADDPADLALSKI